MFTSLPPSSFSNSGFAVRYALCFFLFFGYRRSWTSFSPLLAFFFLHSVFPSSRFFWNKPQVSALMTPPPILFSHTFESFCASFCSPSRCVFFSRSSFRHGISNFAIPVSLREGGRPPPLTRSIPLTPASFLGTLTVFFSTFLEVYRGQKPFRLGCFSPPWSFPYHPFFSFFS